MPEECQKLYKNKFTDPNFQKARKESEEFQKFQNQISLFESITYDENDINDDIIAMNYTKRMGVYGYIKSESLLVLNKENTTCVEEFKDFIGTPNNTYCTKEQIITFFMYIDSSCDSKTDAGEYYECRSEERLSQLLRFEE